MNPAIAAILRIFLGSEEDEKSGYHPNSRVGVEQESGTVFLWIHSSPQASAIFLISSYKHVLQVCRLVFGGVAVSGMRPRVIL